MAENRDERLAFLMQNSQNLHRSIQASKEKQRQQKRNEKAARKPPPSPKKAKKIPKPKKPSSRSSSLKAAFTKKRKVDPLTPPPSFLKACEQPKEDAPEVPIPPELDAAEAAVIRSLANVFDIGITGNVSQEKITAMGIYLTSLITTFNTPLRRKQLLSENLITTDDEDEEEEEEDDATPNEGDDDIAEEAHAERTAENIECSEDEEEEEDEGDEEDNAFIAPEDEIEWEEGCDPEDKKRKKNQSHETKHKRIKKCVEESDEETGLTMEPLVRWVFFLLLIHYIFFLCVCFGKKKKKKTKNQQKKRKDIVKTGRKKMSGEAKTNEQVYKAAFKYAALVFSLFLIILGSLGVAEGQQSPPNDQGQNIALIVVSVLMLVMCLLFLLLLIFVAKQDQTVSFLKLYLVLGLIAFGIATSCIGIVCSVDTPNLGYRATFLWVMAAITTAAGVVGTILSSLFIAKAFNAPGLSGLDRFN